MSKAVHILLAIWLLVTPALAAHHDAEHLDDAIADHTQCVLCQVGERDDDLLASGIAPQTATFQPQNPEALKPQAGLTHYLQSESIRGPPASL
ncbi:hypothetical protein HK107_05870 [Parvularcula sp. ZS-1/3]|uniref:Uncharacterized protein n=1 Tax=Parvularcula mediterranea TaxID=2732508 RepID=A0A7Y3W522_9PROT|nr:hypothetical protein [Parvularcula mediterranea]NNU15847.1 hypothetical protein [Parvularcula mediterranea]